mmetsp:Transcript_11772/g.17268  ORF Transcript_11772/g.17268 Transcript_11772/m.17268 type:complete len:105 (+) Transcript_11772:555-869(+)
MTEGGENTDVDHTVYTIGYGTDEETGKDYWLVRNTWGPFWGEEGTIRLERTEEPNCGITNTPHDGTGCLIDSHGQNITQIPTEICGTRRILYAGVIPVGGQFPQ